MGHNELSILNMSGRMSVDLLKVIMRSYNLGSYKLDNVSAHFIRGYIKEIHITYGEGFDITTINKTDNTKGLTVDGFITIKINRGAFEENIMMDKNLKF